MLECSRSGRNKDNNFMKEKVLIIDDDPGLIEMYQGKFEDEGYAVTADSCGKDGINSAKKVKPDAILIDIMMPEIDGFETMRQIKAEAKNNPVIVIISNLNRNKEMERAIKEGADDFILKANHTPKEVVKRIELHLRKRGK